MGGQDQEGGPRKLMPAAPCSWTSSLQTVRQYVSVAELPILESFVLTAPADEDGDHSGAGKAVLCTGDDASSSPHPPGQWPTWSSPRGQIKKCPHTASHLHLGMGVFRLQNSSHLRKNTHVCAMCYLTYPVCLRLHLKQNMLLSTELREINKK